MPNGQVTTVGDRQRLAQFLSYFRQLLQSVVESGSDPKGRPLFYEELRPLMQAAWQDMDPYFELAFNALGNVSDQQLRLHGLYGAQLKFKLGVISWWNQKFDQGGGAGIFKQLLEVVDELLESLLAALGVGGALAEFKGATKACIKD